MEEIDVMWLQQAESKYHEDEVPDVTDKAEDEIVPELGCNFWRRA